MIKARCGVSPTPVFEFEPGVDIESKDFHRRILPPPARLGTEARRGSTSGYLRRPPRRPVFLRGKGGSGFGV